jgi:hypothetical protein
MFTGEKARKPTYKQLEPYRGFKKELLIAGLMQKTS